MPSNTPSPHTPDDLEKKIRQQLAEALLKEKTAMQTPSSPHPPSGSPPQEPPHLPPRTPRTPLFQPSLPPRDLWMDESPLWAVLIGTGLLFWGFLTQQVSPFILFSILGVLLTLRVVFADSSVFFSTLAFLSLFLLYIFSLGNPPLLRMYLFLSLFIVLFLSLFLRLGMRESSILLGGVIITILAGFQSDLLSFLPKTLLVTAKTFLFYPAVIWAFILASYEPERRIRIPHFFTISILLTLVISVVIGLAGSEGMFSGITTMISIGQEHAPSLQDITPARQSLLQRIYTFTSGTWLQDWIGRLVLVAAGQDTENPDTITYGTHIGIPPPVLYPARVQGDMLLPGMPSPVVIEAHITPTIPPSAITAICQADRQDIRKLCDGRASFIAAFADDPAPITVTPSFETLRALFYSQDYPITLQPVIPRHAGTHRIDLNVTYPFATTTYASFILGDTSRVDTARLQQARETYLSGKELISFGGPVILTVTKPGILTIDTSATSGTLKRPFIITLRPTESNILTNLTNLTITLPAGFSLSPIEGQPASFCDFTEMSKQTERSDRQVLMLSAGARKRVNQLILPSTDPVRIACTLVVDPAMARELLDPASGMSLQGITLTAAYTVTTTAHTQFDVTGVLSTMVDYAGGSTSLITLSPEDRARLAETCSSPEICLILTDDEKQRLLSQEDLFVRKAEAVYGSKDVVSRIARAAFKYCLANDINPAFPLAIIRAENGWDESHFSWSCNNPYDIKYFGLSFMVDGQTVQQKSCEKKAADGGFFAAYDSIETATAHVCAILSHYAKRGQVTPYLMNAPTAVYAYANRDRSWSSNVEESLRQWKDFYAGGSTPNTS